MQNSDPSDRNTLLAQAIEHHMAGRYDEAERLYLALNRITPDDEEVLYLLGVLCCDLGIFDTACRFLDEALLIAPGFVDARRQLAIALTQQGKDEDARLQLSAALHYDPLHRGALVDMAASLTKIDRLDEARHLLETALEQERSAEVFRALGELALRCSHPAEAESFFLEALLLDANPETNNLLGLARLQQRDFIGAVTCLTQVVKASPHLLQARNNLGLALRHLNHFDEARANFEAALEIAPDYMEARVNLAETLRLLGFPLEAQTHLQLVLATEPDSVAALNNLGAVYQDIGQPNQALQVLKRAEAKAPGDPGVGWNLALTELALGDYENGWRHYESRWQGCANLRGAYTKPDDRAWKGEPIAGKRVLIWAEQGFGDTLQFIRYAKLLAEQGAIVLAEVQPPLVALLQATPGLTHVVARDAPLPEYDFHCPLMSLPYRFGTRVETIPAQIPYLFADPVRVEAWQQRLAQYPGKKVGLVWAGSSRPGASTLKAIDARRSMALSKLLPVLEVSDVNFFSLQKDAAAMQLQFLPSSVTVHDFTTEWNDFSDTAAFVANLDLVISVDTAVAHLSGGVGRPVWLLNRFDTCWRWLWGRDDSPWYPLVHQFRQPTWGNWDSPVRAIADALMQWRAR